MMIHPEQLEQIIGELVDLFGEGQSGTNRRIALVIECPEIDDADQPVEYAAARIAFQSSSPNEERESTIGIKVYIDNGSRWALTETAELAAGGQTLFLMNLAHPTLLNPESVAMIFPNEEETHDPS